MRTRGYPGSPAVLIGGLFANRQLIGQMTRREVVGRYSGSIVGLMWSFVHPFLMLAVYTFVFSVVFEVRWGADVDSKAEFAIVLFSGLIVHSFFSECVTRAPWLVLGNVNYVKKVVFPLETLGWVTVFSALFHTAMSILVLLIFYAGVHLGVHWTVVLLPLVFAPFALLTLGVTWFLASFSVFVRDIAQVVGIATTALLFLSPILYPVSSVPEQYRLYVHLSPLTFIVEQVREVVLWGHLPDWRGLLIYTAVSVVIAWGGFYWFQKTRRGFADVI